MCRAGDRLLPVVRAGASRGVGDGGEPRTPPARFAVWSRLATPPSLRAPGGHQSTPVPGVRQTTAPDAGPTRSGRGHGAGRGDLVDQLAPAIRRAGRAMDMDIGRRVAGTPWLAVTDRAPGDRAARKRLVGRRAPDGISAGRADRFPVGRGAARRHGAAGGIGRAITRRRRRHGGASQRPGGSGSPAGAGEPSEPSGCVTRRAAERARGRGFTAHAIKLTDPHRHVTDPPRRGAHHAAPRGGGATVADPGADSAERERGRRTPGVSAVRGERTERHRGACPGATA